MLSVIFPHVCFIFSIVTPYDEVFERYRLSVIVYRLSFISYYLSAIGYRLSFLWLKFIVYRLLVNVFAVIG